MPDILNRSHLENIAKGLLLLQIFLITWLCSGTRVEHLMPMFIVSFLLYTFITITKLPVNKTPFEKTLFISSILFILLALFQYANPSAEVVVEEKFTYIKNLNYIEFLPTSVKAEFHRGNPLFSLCVLLTSFLTTISALALFNDRNFAKTAIATFALNTTAMGGFAIFQKLSGFASPYNLFDSTTTYYGTFFLSNAAGAFLNMGMAASIGGFAIYVKKSGATYRLISASYALCIFITGFSAYYSGSRGAQIIAIAIFSLFIFYVASTTLRNILNIKIFAWIFPILIITVASAAILTSNIEGKISGDIKYSFSGRAEFYKAGIKILGEHPILGIGGECSRYFLPKEIMPAKDAKNSPLYIPERPHSDILEYAMEYGITGISILAICGLAWIYSLYKKIKYCTFSNFVLAAGALSCLLNGSFDMELHITSTMVAFGLMCSWSLVNFKEARHEIR